MKTASGIQGQLNITRSSDISRRKRCKETNDKRRLLKEYDRRHGKGGGEKNVFLMRGGQAEEPVNQILK